MSADILWLTGEYFEPRSQGMFQYSSALADELGQRVDGIRFIGRARTDFATDAVDRDDWTVLPPKHRSNASRVVSPWPTKIGDIWGSDYRRAVRAALLLRPKVVVIDHMRAAGALTVLPKDVPVVYISHNDEYAVKRLAARNRSRIHERVAFGLDALKHRVYENWLLRRSRVVTSITPEDAAALGARVERSEVIHAPPVWNGCKRPDRTITADTPREILLLGSLAWDEKRKNLAELLAVLAEGGLEDAHITVTGGGYPAGELEEQFPDVDFHAFVEDLDALKDRARLGIIYEPVGGGFKMKVLDYVFSRIPLVIMEGSAVGLRMDAGVDYIETSDLDDTAREAGRVIDDLERLNDLQTRAFERCEVTFSTESLGPFLDAVTELL